MKQQIAAIPQSSLKSHSAKEILVLVGENIKEHGDVKPPLMWSGAFVADYDFGCRHCSDTGHAPGFVIRVCEVSR